jgi:acetyl-CoA decarbonylase/synthase, CODH/ACS complex subunit beta
MQKEKLKAPSIAFVERDFEKAGKLPKPKIYKLPPIDDSFNGIEDIGIGPEYFGHIRKGEYHAEFGGPKTDYLGCTMIDVCSSPDEVEDAVVKVYGPELSEIEPESTLPFIVHVKAWGREMSFDHMEYLGRIVASGMTSVEGMTWLGATFEPWMRISKKMVQKHNFSLGKFGQIYRAYVTTTVPLVEKMEVDFIVGEPTEGKLTKDAPKAISMATMKEVLEAMHVKQAFYDAYARMLEDADVDTFYGCTLCKMIAPNHACIVSPTNIPFCGFATWSGLKVTYEVEAGGYAFAVAKGSRIDPGFHWYEGVDHEVYSRSNFAYKHFFLNSAIVYPSTNCGCFEGGAFYIPEVDGIGLVHRRYTGDTPLGVPFSTLAGFMSGGEQNHGFKGVSVRNMMMKQFLSDDGGWDRVVWAAKTVKEEIAESVPEEIYDKIATEDDAIEPDDIKEWLRKKNHPIVKYYWSQTGGEPDPLVIPPPSKAWPDAEFKKALDRVRKARELRQAGG